MATRSFDVSTAPAPMPDAVTGTWYAVQNVGPITVFLSVATETPDMSAESRRVLHAGDSYEALANAGEQIYLWTPYGESVVSFEENA